MFSAKFAKTLVKKGFGLTILYNFKNFDGFLIENCRIIHSIFMWFSFDAVFLDKDLRVIATYSDFKPFRISKFHKKSRYVLELPKGTVKKLKINPRIAALFGYDTSHSNDFSLREILTSDETIDNVTRKVLYRKYILGYDNSQIALELGLSELEVYTILDNGFKILISKYPRTAVEVQKTMKIKRR